MLCMIHGPELTVKRERRYQAVAIRGCVLEPPIPLMSQCVVSFVEEKRT